VKYCFAELAKTARVAASFEMRGEEIPVDFAADFALPNSKLYPALSHQLGLLPPSLVLLIVTFHAFYDEVHESLRLISGARPVRYSVAVLLRPAISAITQIEPALRQIERMADLTQAADVDISKASEVLEWEEEKFRRAAGEP
jgi:hypothetical protein